VRPIKHFAAEAPIPRNPLSILRHGTPLGHQSLVSWPSVTLELLAPAGDRLLFGNNTAFCSVDHLLPSTNRGRPSSFQIDGGCSFLSALLVDPRSLRSSLLGSPDHHPALASRPSCDLATTANNINARVSIWHLDTTCLAD
jgi:hypothetical protein